MFTVIRETYRLFKRFSDTYFVVFLLQLIAFSLLLSTSFVVLKFPEIRNNIENRFVAKVFFKSGSAQKEINSVVKKLKQNRNLQIEFIDSKDAAKIFSKRLNINEDILLKEVRFPVSVNIRFTGNYSYSEILSFLKKLEKDKAIESIHYPRKSAFALSKHFTLISIIIFAVILLLLIGLFFIIRKFSDKIHEMLKDEMEIKLLIGVRPFYVHFPFQFSISLTTIFALFLVVGIAYSIIALV